MQKNKSSTNGEGLKTKKNVFGGSLLGASNPKVGRPLDAKLPIYVVLRSKKSAMRQPKVIEHVNETVLEVAKKHGVRCYDFANVGNQLQLVIKLPQVKAWRKFIRELTGKIAQEVKGFEKLDDNFWKYRPYTKIIKNWQEPFQEAKEFIHLNSLEASGSIKATETKRLKDLKDSWQI